MCVHDTFVENRSKATIQKNQIKLLQTVVETCMMNDFQDATYELTGEKEF